MVESGENLHAALMLERVDTLPLSVRTQNCLLNNSIVTLGDLVKRTEFELLDTPNFGAKSLAELKDFLSSVGLSIPVGVRIKKGIFDWMDKPPVKWPRRYDD